MNIKIIKIKVKVWWAINKSNMGGAWWIFKRAWFTLLGKEGIVDSREVYSKGGFRYIQVEFAEFPLKKG